MKKLTFRTIFRLDKDRGILRLFRLIYNVGNVGDGKGYSAKITLALTKRLFRLRKELWGFEFCLLGLRLHHKKSYGGYFV